MAYETVYQIPESVVQGEKNRRFITGKDKELLEPHDLVHFTRTQRVSILDDYPVRGAHEERLVETFVEGPFDSRTEIPGSSTTKVDFPYRLIKTADMPYAFSDVTLRRYGLAMDAAVLRHLLNVHTRLDHARVEEIGMRAAANLREVAQCTEGKDRYIGRADDCVVVLETGRYNRFPIVTFSAFGIGERPNEILGALGLRDLQEEYREVAHVALIDQVRRGKAYNFSMGQIKVPMDAIGIDNIVI